MNPAAAGLLLLGILLNAVAQLLLKMGVNSVVASSGAFAYTRENFLPIGLKLITQLPILGGLSCYVISVVVWILGLSRVDVSIAYPLLSLGYVLNALGAYYFLGEALSLQRWAGIGIIIVGVYVLARS